MAKDEHIVEWKCHTPRLFEEILVNEVCSILHAPLKIMLSILREVGERAIELDDDKLTALMLRLTLYSVADPSESDYDPKRVAECLRKARN